MRYLTKLHDHEDGHPCYAMRSSPNGYRYSDLGLCRTIGLDFHTNHFAVAYLGYTGHWYAFDLETGEEIATFSRTFYERFIAPMRYADLEPDPECGPLAKTGH